MNTLKDFIRSADEENDFAAKISQITGNAIITSNFDISRINGKFPDNSCAQYRDGDWGLE